MLLRRVLLVAALFCSGLSAAQVYKWVDEDGVVHFSDQPRPGAEEIELAPAPSIPAAPPARTPPQAAGAEDEEAVEAEDDPGYESLRVVSPGPEVTLWNIGGTLDVRLDLQPSLRPGHQVRLYFDGSARDVRGTSFQLQEVYRGTHNIQAEVVDENGELQIRSENHRFYVQQTSIINNN